MNFNFGGLGQSLSEFGKKMGNGLSSGLSKAKDAFGSTENKIIQPMDLNTGSFNGAVIQQSDLNPDVFRGSVIQQPDLDNPAKLTLKDRLNAIPQENKSAFAQAMGENAQQEQIAPINYIPQDYSWALQPTRGSMFYG